ncbi:hypothetical protein OG474_09890 [Kribbella sp. NBC_01505]|uniref:hypothetical protein n=1 Tax=Kribbella sp. NBC_01505 TaxID=2903580 RepID=UPI00386D26E2
MSTVDPTPVRRTYTLEFYDEQMAREFDAAVSRGEESYVMVPTEHRVFGWDRPNGHKVYVQGVADD